MEAASIGSSRKASMVDLRGLSWYALAKQTVNKSIKDDIFTCAAALAFYFLLSLFPALFFLTALLGFLAETGSAFRAMLLEYLETVMPESAYALIAPGLEEIRAGAEGWKLLVGMAGALWAAATAITAVVSGLNVAYSVTDARPWWKVRLLSLGLMIVFVGMIVTALTMLLFGDHIGHRLANLLGLSDAFRFVWGILRWVVVLFFVLLAFALIYRYAPDLENTHWDWITPGAVVGLVFWLLISFVFRLYLAGFGAYNDVYGSLGAAIVLLLWLWFTGIALMLGGEANAVIENAAAARGAAGAHLSGHKEPVPEA